MVMPLGLKTTGAGGNTPWIPELPLLNVCAAADEAAGGARTNTTTGIAYWIFFLKAHS